MYLGMELIGLCLVFWLMCWMGTGSDEKNLKSLSSYPEPVQCQIRAAYGVKNLKKPASHGKAFLSNLVLFVPVLLILGIFLKKDSFPENFITILILGEGLNLFDLLIIDLCWWRNSPRVRFSKVKIDPQLYRDPKTHVASFLRALPMFLLAALFDGWILTIL